jgi:hypothetical protein
MQRLRALGIECEEFAFTSTSTGRLAAALFNAIRDRALALPPDEALLDELEHVRLRESSPGVFRLDHDAGRHDDRAVALGLAVTALLQDESSGPVAAFRIDPARGTLAGDVARERGEVFDPDEDDERPSGAYHDAYGYHDSPIDSWTFGGDQW